MQPQVATSDGLLLLLKCSSKPPLGWLEAILGVVMWIWVQYTALCGSTFLQLITLHCLICAMVQSLPVFVVWSSSTTVVWIDVM